MMNLGLHGLDPPWWAIDGFERPPWESIQNRNRIPVFGRPGERIFAVRDAGPVYERAVVTDTDSDPDALIDMLVNPPSAVLPADAPAEMAPRVLHRRLYERRLVMLGTDRRIYATYVDRHEHADERCTTCDNLLPQIALYLSGQRGQVCVN